MVLLVKGQWVKSHEGWRFAEDPNFEPRHIIVGNSDQVEAVKDLVRSVFTIRRHTPMVITFQLPQWMVEHEGDSWPPHNIRTNADFDMLMSVHEWNVDPKLCVIIGAEDVATYQFRCRTPFTIGSRAFLADGGNEDQHMASVLGNLYETCILSKVKF